MESRKVPKMTLGLRMMVAMEAAGLTSGEMAKRLKVSRHSVSGWLHGRHQPNHATLERWSEICDVDLDYILGQISDESPTKEQLAKILVDQLLGSHSPARYTHSGVTLAELDLRPDCDDDDAQVIDLRNEPLSTIDIRQLAPAM